MFSILNNQTIIPARPDEFIVKGATNLAVARHELATPLDEPAQGI